MSSTAPGDNWYGRCRRGRASAKPVVKAYIEGGEESAVSAGDYLRQGLRNMTQRYGAGRASRPKHRSEDLFVSYVSPSATATSNWTVDAYIGKDAEVEAGEDLTILAKSYSGKVVSDVNGKSYSLAGLGNNVSSTTITNTVSAHVDEDVSLSAESIDVNARGKSDAYATTYGGSGGLIAGASASAGTNVTNTAAPIWRGTMMRRHR